MGNFVPYPGSLIEENSSGFTEYVESDSSETDSSESESDSSETEPDMDEEMAVLSGLKSYYSKFIVSCPYCGYYISIKT
jgi:hypothetical protein